MSAEINMYHFNHPFAFEALYHSLYKSVISFVMSVPVSACINMAPVTCVGGDYYENLSTNFKLNKIEKYFG